MLNKNKTLLITSLYVPIGGAADFLFIEYIAHYNEKYSPVTVTTGCFIAGSVTSLPICVFNRKISKIVELPIESIIMVIIFSLVILLVTDKAGKSNYN